MPRWAPGLAVGVLPGPYREIVEVLQDAVHPMRAHHLCAALGLSTDKSKVGGFRSKLKRLVGRGRLTEEGPGLFMPREALAAAGPNWLRAGPGWRRATGADLTPKRGQDSLLKPRSQADRLGLSADQWAAADRACRYLENNAAHLHYDKALQAGWPIASGIVEGAARHLVADSLDITGSRWTVPGAEAVLTLRALISNGDFPQYRTFHNRRERELLYPRPDQHNNELSA